MKTNLKLTEWFDGFQFDPMREGLYECINRNTEIKYFMYWNNEVGSWFSVRFMSKKRFKIMNLPDLFDWQYPMWRGVVCIENS